MIISCINCNKNFDVNSSLIPSNGRLIECGSCNHRWFFKNEPTTDNNKISDKPIIETKSEDTNKFKLKNIDLSLNKDAAEQNKKINIKSRKKSYKKNNILSIILVFIISFISLIILIDTFKSPISTLIPNLELILYSLYETIKDITLFFKDLI